MLGLSREEIDKVNKMYTVAHNEWKQNVQPLTLIRPGGGIMPPPLHDFSDCSRTHMDGASPLADFFL